MNVIYYRNNRWQMLNTKYGGANAVPLIYKRGAAE